MTEVEAPASALTSVQEEGLKNLYEPLYPDFTLKCGTKEFKVHRTVLGWQSDYFKTMFDGPWNENQAKIVIIEDQDPFLIEQALRFFYAKTYNAVQTPEKEKLLFDTRMFCLADFFVAPKLQLAALQEATIRLNWSEVTIEEYAQVAELVFGGKRANDTRLRAVVLGRFVEGFHDCKPSQSKGEKNPAELGSLGDVLGQVDDLNPFSRDFEQTTDNDKDSRPNKEQKLNTANDQQTNEEDVTQQGSRTNEILSGIASTLVREEPLAYFLKLRQQCREELLGAMYTGEWDQKEVLAEELVQTRDSLKKLQNEVSEGSHLARLAKKHTKCRNESCTRKDFILDRTPSGGIKGFRCLTCNAKHTKIH